MVDSCFFVGERQNHTAEERWDGSYCNYLWKMQYATFGVSGMENNSPTLYSYSRLCFQILNAFGNGVSSLFLSFPLPVSLPSKFIEFPQRDSLSAIVTSLNSDNGLSHTLLY